MEVLSIGVSSPFLSYSKHMSKNLKQLSNKGQALVEYLGILVLLGFIALKLSGLINEGMKFTVGTLAYRLSEELSTGVCSRNCFFDGYKN